MKAHSPRRWTATSVITDKTPATRPAPTSCSPLQQLRLPPHASPRCKGLATTIPYADGNHAPCAILWLDEFHTFDWRPGHRFWPVLIRRRVIAPPSPGDALLLRSASSPPSCPESREAMLHYAGQIFSSGSERRADRRRSGFHARGSSFPPTTAYGMRTAGGLFRPCPLPRLEGHPQLDPANANQSAET